MNLSRPLRPLRHTPFGERLAVSPFRPMHWKRSLAAARKLWFAYGHLRSVCTETSIDANGEPLAWYTYPAIEYLSQFDFSDRRVFEFGSGNSTLYWARRARTVVSVEHDRAWYEQLRDRVPANCTLIYEPDLDRYARVILDFAEPFDIVVVDGPARQLTRARASAAAVSKLNRGGLIILDNSDWLPRSAQLLRDADLLQVDFHGFVPIAEHTQTTSLYFDRECRLRPLGRAQPHPSLGAARKDWETNQVPDGSLTYPFQAPAPSLSR